MNGQLWQVTPTQVQGLIAADDATMRFARLSHPLLAGIYEDQVACVLGLVPSTLLADSAYLWLWIDLDVIDQHRVSFGRHAKRAIAGCLQLYHEIHGHCLEDHSIRWLRTLGAVFRDDGAFTIRKSAP